MTRETKILIASGLLQVVVAVAKAGATTPDAFLDTAKDQAVPLIVNVGGLFLIMHMIK